MSSGIARERAPQDGDYWRGCDDARAAGTAPIYRGEPGYREGMDGDNNGIACEPYR
ncbi:excalibur calcium-binding domain-containing protein [Sphingopyxis sp. H115]|uniref:excalibur calcium-binding domain-containing protein n=1 Tax=Sphingopyxis sp. H115 TaxID=1759073 RepID=UPI001910749E|nr:excalibur calcium-binding domain-containing protein [Sphingopyxis sp. H115]